MTRASYEVNTMGLDVGPLHRRLLDYFNEMHEARATGDTKSMEELEAVVPKLLEKFAATECLDSPNPEWLANKMRAGWQVARGDVAAALKFESIGYHHAAGEPADGDNVEARRRKSVSASNIADQMWRLGRAEEGLRWAKLSVELWPSNSVNYLVLAITAYHAGLTTDADQLFAQLRQATSFDDDHDVLAKCMEFEQELRNMSALASVRGLLEDLGARNK